MSAPAPSAPESPRPRFWTRSPSVDTRDAPRRESAPTRSREPRRPSDYGPDARPERQGALATLLPTRPLRVALAIGGIALVTGTTLAVGFRPEAFDALGRLAGPRFAGTVHTLRGCLDLRAGALAATLADLFLVSAAAVALSVRGMRRHRRDGRHGRARAWTMLSLVLATAAIGARVPVGRLFATLLTDATGRTLGPEGAGWWIAAAGLASVVAALWSILPLHQRLLPGLWLTLGLASWGVAAAAPWLAVSAWVTARGIDMSLVAPAAWLVGAATLLVAMLVAARGVIREVRGEIRAAPVTAVPASAARSVAAKPVTARPAAEPRPVKDADEEPAQEPVFEPVATGSDATPAAERSDGGYTDGSDLEDDYASRPLSKAERKRLRKLAKSGQAA